MEMLALIPLWLACGLVIGFFAGKHYAKSKEEDEEVEEENNIPLNRAIFDENGFEHTWLLEFQLQEHDITLTRVEPFQNVHKFKDVYHWNLRIGDSYTKTISYVHELKQAFNDCGIDKEIIV